MDSRSERERLLWALNDVSYTRGEEAAQRSTQTGLGKVREPAREIDIVRDTDVLIVGGGPAGCAAAVAAVRLGADVTLVERYGHLGGLSTGGLVIWIDRMTDWTGEQVVTGIANDLFDRLPPESIYGPRRADWGSQDPATAAYWADRSAGFRGIVTWSPTVDPEWLKLVSQHLVCEAGVNLMLHAYGVMPIVEERTVRGVIFESKEGRQAIRAQVVVDTTGDGDMYARAGAAFESDIDETDIHHCMNLSWLWGGVDMARWFAFKNGQPAEYAAFMRQGAEALGFLERPHVSWREDVALFMGPRLSGYSPLSVADLTTVEIESRRRLVEHLRYFRAHAPGFENAWVLLTSPQMGVRHSRRLTGIKPILNADWKAGVRHADEIAVTPAPSPKFPNVSIPYGSLVPLELDGLLAAGRHIASDPQSHTFLREIPQCWQTGQAAGVGAALAADRGVRPRDVPIADVQHALVKQGVLLRQAEVAGPRPA